MIRIRLSTSQISALECSGLDGQDQTASEKLLLASWIRSSRLRGDWLEFEAEQLEAIVEALTEAANSEDAIAGQTWRTPEERRAARAAARSLTTLAGKVRKAAA